MIVCAGTHAHHLFEGSAKGALLRASPRSRAISTRVQAGVGASIGFEVQKRVEYGDLVKIVGSHASLGGWEVAKGVSVGASCPASIPGAHPQCHPLLPILQLKWHEGDWWRAEVDLPISTQVEFKVVVLKASGEAEWEEGSNRQVAPADHQGLAHIGDASFPAHA